MMNIPSKALERDFIQAISLRELFSKDDSSEFIKFNYDDRSNTKLEYRIPDHQRFPQWSLKKKRKLIDSVFRNYTMTGLILSGNIDVDQESSYYDIEDGQTRLSVLQEYYVNVFRYCENIEEAASVGLKYSELSIECQDRFLDYKLSREVVKKTRTRPHDTQTSHINEMFERLQEGMPLKDFDKYWNRSSDPLVSFAMELINHYRDTDFGKHMDIKKFNGNDRRRLSDICGLISGVLYGGKDGEHDKHTSPSFNLQFDIIRKPISIDAKKKVYDFCEYYSEIISRAYGEDNLPFKKGHLKQQFYNMNKIMGVILVDWKNNSEGHWIDASMNEEKRKIMWIDIINIARISKNFMKGSATLWFGFPKGDIQNTFLSNINKRIKRIHDFYQSDNNWRSAHKIEYESWRSNS